MNGKPKIPTPVPLAKADPERQKLYSGLKENPDTAPVSAPKIEIPIIGASTEEKQEFVRAILGKVPYIKTYTIFGRITVEMASRTIEESEKLFESIGQLTAKDDKNCWSRRYRLFSCLRKVKDLETGSYYDVPTNILEGDWKENVERFLLKLPAPVYLALMQISDDFEAHVKELVGAATKPGFWPTVGQS